MGYGPFLFDETNCRALHFNMNRFQSILHHLRSRILVHLSRAGYWEMRAKDIDASYGHDDNDYAAVQSILEIVQPQHLLDIGCGTGRLFPVFLQVGVPDIIGQEISSWAIKTARERFPQQSIQFDHRELATLPYGDQHFDLIISNRVLSAVPSDELQAVLRNLVRMTKYLYLNEFSPSDGGHGSDYWFLHDYEKVLRSLCTYSVIKKGAIGTQSYQLLKIESPPSSGLK